MKLRISVAVEGLADEAVARRLLRDAGLSLSGIHGLNGKGKLLKNITRYNSRAKFEPWLVLIDLNHDFDCPPPAMKVWLPEPATGMCFRIVVREIEAWLLADRENFAQFFSVPPSQVPASPEELEDPKLALLHLILKSRKRFIREMMLPSQIRKFKVGPGYNALISEFVLGRHSIPNNVIWRPEVAAKSSESLNRCLSRLNQLTKHCVTSL